MSKCRFAANTIKKQSSSSQRTTNNAAVLFVDVIPVVIAVVVVVASVHSFHHQHHIFRRASVVIGFIFSISRHCLALALLWSQHFFFSSFLAFPSIPFAFQLHLHGFVSLQPAMRVLAIRMPI